MKSSSIAVLAVWVAATVTALQPTVAVADSVGPYGVHRQAMRIADIDGRPYTFSESDIFACVKEKAGGTIYRVPYGYVTDQTSIPRSIAGHLVGDSLNPLFANAAIVHDYLYAVGEPNNAKERRRADAVMVSLLNAEHVDADVVRTIATAFAALQAGHSLKPTISALFGGFWRDAEKWLKSLPAAFGAEREWERWANPYTLTLLDPADRPEPRLPPPVVATLENCEVFDQAGEVTDTAHRMLHACLHLRYRSPGERPQLTVASGERRDWPAPRMPTALEDFAPMVTRTDPGSETCEAFD